MAFDDSYVDLNRFDGSDDELVKWISPAGGILPPRPPRPSQSVDAAITAKGVDVNVTVNGNGGRTVIRPREDQSGISHSSPAAAERRDRHHAKGERHLTFLVTEHGKPFSDRVFGNKMRERCDEMGLPRTDPEHGLRKSAATALPIAARPSGN